MFCSKCGAELKEGTKFCPKCGYRLGGGAPVQNNKENKAVKPVKVTPGNQKQGRKPPKKKKGIAVIILSVVLFFLVAGISGGVIYYFIEGKEDTKIEDEWDEDTEDKDSVDDEENEEDMDDADSEENADDEENESESEGPTVAEEVPTEPATEALDIPVTAALQYASQTNMSGMVKAVTVRESAVESSHVVQRDTTIDNSAWSAFDGQSTTSWQEGVDGDGIGQYMGIGFDREYQVQVVTFMLGNHRSDDWYVRNNTPKTLSISLGAQTFQVSFPKEKTEFAVVLSSPVAATDIRITIDDVYRGTQYSDTIIAEVGVYGN